MYCSIDEAWGNNTYTNNKPSQAYIESFDQQNTYKHHSHNRHNSHNNNTMRSIEKFQHLNNDKRPEFSGINYTNQSDISERFNNQVQTPNHRLYHQDPNQHQTSHQTHQSQQLQHQQLQQLTKCQDSLLHIEECEECRNYLINKYSQPSRLSELLTSNPQLKETIVVFLIGILILMILNLFYK